MRMLKFSDEDYLYHWTKDLAARGDLVEVEFEVVKAKPVPTKEVAIPEEIGELVASSEEVIPKKKAGRPKKVND